MTGAITFGTRIGGLVVGDKPYSVNKRFGWRLQYGGFTSEIQVPITGNFPNIYHDFFQGSGIVPPRRVDLALLLHSALTKPEILDKVRDHIRIWDNPMGDYGIETPNRLLYVPKGSSEHDKELGGILVRRDNNFSDALRKMTVPRIDSWVEREGLFYNPEGADIFVPLDSLSQDFAKNGLARAILGYDGVEIVQSLSSDTGFGIRVNTHTRQGMPKKPSLSHCAVGISFKDKTIAIDGFSSRIQPILAGDELAMPLNQEIVPTEREMRMIGVKYY